jgi:lipid II:glycine glycyltransferase (peptidoglycan interpeptide bridge formation enzyme)
VDNVNHGRFRTAGSPCGICYYHYAGSFDRHRNIGIGQALVIGAAEFAKSRGYGRLHLGGGLSTNTEDSLLRFKSGFSKRRAWCYTYTRELAQEQAA